MPTTGVVDGTDLVVLINGNVIGHSKTHSIDMSDAGIDTTSKDSAGWETSIGGLKSVTLSGDGLVAFDDSYTVDDLTTLLIAGTIVSYQYTTDTSGDKYWTGNGRIESISMNSANKEATTYTFSIKGTAALTNPTKT